MVFGLGKGKIEVLLEKYNFSPGDTIKGRITLKLKKPIRAKALKVGLVGEKKRHNIERVVLVKAKHIFLSLKCH